MSHYSLTASIDTTLQNLKQAKAVRAVAQADLAAASSTIRTLEARLEELRAQETAERLALDLPSDHVLYIGTPPSLRALQEWVRKETPASFKWSPGLSYVFFETEEQRIRVYRGYYVMRDSKGWYYTRKPLSLKETSIKTRMELEPHVTK